MAYPHEIRLRGPWQFEPVAHSLETPDGQIVEQCDNLPPPGRCTVPSDWGATLGTNFRGRVAYRRSFNPPGTLDPHERLWLVVEGADARGVVSLNGQRLGDVEGYAVWSNFDITRLLGPRNEISLEVELPAGDAPLRPGRENLPGGPVGEVRLEVRSEQFIEGLALWSCGDSGDPKLAVRGRIGGESNGTRLAVVVGALDRELAYLEPKPGAEFEEVFPAGGLPIWTPDSPATAPVEIKLLDGGASVWQQTLAAGFRGPGVSSNSVRLETILSERDYLEFDQKGTTIIQHVPSTWIDSICPRLAHHPCIVAWSGPAEQPAQSPTFGRPWY